MVALRKISAIVLTISAGLVLLAFMEKNLLHTHLPVMGEVWLHKSILIFAVFVLFIMFIYPLKKFYLLFPDVVLCAFCIITLLTYNPYMNAEPEKLLFGAQILILWFLLRFTLLRFSFISTFLLYIIVLTGIMEAVYGIMQLSGYMLSNHNLFSLTGSFSNPGPYSGYVAMILPICMGFILGTDYADYTVKSYKKLSIIKRKNIIQIIYSLLRYLCNLCLKYLPWITLFSILIVLPAGMSRSAWIAGGISCIWVYWCYRIGWKKTIDIWNENKKKVILIGAVILLMIITGIVGIYHMKKDSANGRFLIWKVTAMAIAKQPVTGTGLGGFPAAYADTQAEYFASGKATETEKYVAGCPEYAFNEYLQMGLELGVLGLVAFLLWLGSVIYYGVKNKRYGVTGSILSLAIFAFSSYPLQLPSFWILLIFLSVIAISNPPEKGKDSKTGIKISSRWFIIFPLLSFVLFFLQKDYPEAYRNWNKAQLLYNSNAYEEAYESYNELYPRLNHRPEFLFEAGQCLSKMERYEESNRLLERATLLSADPMIHYILAKNNQASGQYEEAEKRFLHAIYILPERIYPYYLLTKLYAEPAFYQPNKMKAAADSVLYKEPKVMTTAIREMREEVKRIVNCKL